MEEPTPLPTRAELQKLLGMLLFEDDEIDDVSASIILERAGVNSEKSQGRLATRLQNTVAQMKAGGKQVPKGVIEMIKFLQPGTPVEEAEPHDVIEALLRGHVLGAPPDRSEAAHVQAFRSNEMDYLTEEDIEILEEISKELRDQARDK
jgi:hypothetical protein